MLRIASHRCSSVMRSFKIEGTQFHLYSYRNRLQTILPAALTTMAVFRPRYIPLRHRIALLYSGHVLPNSEPGTSALSQLCSDRSGFQGAQLTCTQAFDGRPSIQPGCQQRDVIRQRSHALEAWFLESRCPQV